MWQDSPQGMMSSCFRSAKAVAAGMPGTGERGAYTAEMFRADFPQFFHIPASEEGKSEPVPVVPEGMLEQFLNQANDSVLPVRWGSLWRYAAGLYTAHFSSLYLKTYEPSSESAAEITGRAAPAGVVKTAAMGDTTVSYDNSAVTSGTEKWGAWNATQYGQQLVALARLAGMGGVYVI